MTTDTKLAAPSPFSRKLPAFQIAWDSTSLGWFKDCPRLYQYSMLQQWTPRTRGIHLYFGGLYASGVERYAHHRAAGHDHNTATRMMVRWVLENSGEYAHTPDCSHHDSEFGSCSCNPSDPGGNGVWTPWESNDPYKNRYTLIRSLIWNVDDRDHSPFKTMVLSSGKPAVELSFNFHVFDVAGHPISLSGHMDEIVEVNGAIFVKDDKAQPTTCSVLTPTGWTTIGELAIGNKIAGVDGQFHNVTELHPRGVAPTYLVDFQDGSYTYCAHDHLWTTAPAGSDGWVTKPLYAFMDAVNKGQRRHIPVCQPVNHPEASLPVDPYLLGALLGDGHFGGHSVQFTNSKAIVLSKVDAAVVRMGDVFRKNPADNLCWTITNNRNCATLKGLQKLSLWGKLSAAKFIPEQYLFASIDQRWQLLQGLLDTDGSWSDVSRRYQTMSMSLANDVASLVRSLGGSAIVTVQPRGMYRVTIRVGECDMPIARRYIKSITRIADAENICVGVDADDHLYLTDHYIATHNTTKTALTPRYFDQYSPNNQMSLYTVAGRVIFGPKVQGVFVRAAQILVEGTRFANKLVPRPTAVTDEWLNDTRQWIELAHHYAEKNYWPKNDKSCDKFGGCPFRKVCSVSPSHREAWLREDFVKREWNPLESRGDI